MENLLCHPEGLLEEKILEFVELRDNYTLFFSTKTNIPNFLTFIC